MSNVLALAQYAHTRLEPLFARAKAVDKSIMFSIEAVFADEDSVFHSGSYLKVWAHWSRGDVFQNSPHLESMPDVDKFAAQVEADVVKLEAAE
ncbi:hypothetical protein [Arthrobacter sp. MA-N2]|uniref:hypothetical protein n=1 Tax=Arthrobacter sp. MA-N2 TaxID=1101188 RepID=UPI000484741C|nr:hypothetical protein [Arthrobacter sp. MA-N2]